ncbi:MAG: hypothetical protein HKN40_07410 [Winogradskyella sp.]|uniref:hypothetical protein n=1 Tax=Winogradskyella sp. TaxID=1883156 RepID=UPI0017B7642E|nr:hypothetical protein [Winogradskyella sp.]
MFSKIRYTASIVFTILFMAMISAPAIILSFDDSTDVSIFYSITEEEESKKLQLIIDDSNVNYDGEFLGLELSKIIGYTFKTYPKPHLNLIIPPPEFII